MIITALMQYFNGSKNIMDQSLNDLHEAAEKACGDFLHRMFVPQTNVTTSKPNSSNYLLIQANTCNRLSLYL